MRQGVTFHNGKDVTAEDAWFSIQRVADPKAPLSGGGQLSQILDFESTKVVDATTLELVLKVPYAILDGLLAEYTVGIIPTDFDIANPVGTGAFAYKSFDPGKTSTFTKYADYWGDAAFVDELQIQDFPDPSAMVNALQAGQIQTVDSLPYNLIDTIKGAGGGVAGLRDGRLGAVHHARRPGAVQRRQGAPGDAPDRRPPADDRPDAERLRLAGQRHVRTVRRGVRRATCPSASRTSTRPSRCSRRPARRASRSSCSPATTSARSRPAAANLFVEQAKLAGVDVKVTKKTPFYDDQYLQYTFAQDFWNTRNYIPQAVVGTFPPEQGGTYNETHWDNQEHRDLVNAAAQELDETKRGRAAPRRAGDRVQRGRPDHLGLPPERRRLRRQRQGPRAEQVPPARVLQVQQGLGPVGLD